jgi:hypothetical protein
MPTVFQRAVSAGDQKHPDQVQQYSKEIPHEIPLSPQSRDPTRCHRPLDIIKVQVNRHAGMGIADHGYHRYSGYHPKVQVMSKRSTEESI